MADTTYTTKRTNPLYKNKFLNGGNNYTMEELLAKTQLDFNVIKAPAMAYLKGLDIKQPITAKIIPNSYALVRDDTGYCFNSNGKLVTSVYEVFQNHEMLEFVNSLCSTKDINIVNLGSYNGGHRVFFLVDLNDVISIQNDDIIERYLLITGKHDGTGSLTIKFTNVRVICENTLQIALKDESKHQWAIRHTTNMDDKLDVVHSIIHSYQSQKENILEQLQLMLKLAISDKQEKALLMRCFFNDKEFNLLQKNNYIYNNEVTDNITGTKLKNFSELRLTTDVGIGQDLYRGTLLHTLNGITCYTNNVKVHKTEESAFNDTIEDTLQMKFNQTAITFLQNFN